MRLNSNLPLFLGRHLWTAWHAGQIVGRAAVYLQQAAGTEHLAEFELEVLPAWRLQGLGRRLIARVVAAAQKDHRQLLLTETYSSVPAGREFLHRLGGTVGQALDIHQLALRDLQPALLDQWQARAASRAAGFQLECWDGPWPEADLEEMVALSNTVRNLSPHDALEHEEEGYTAAQVREEDAYRAQTGVIVWTLVAREQSTEVLAGYTEVYWRPFRPTIMWQGATGVLPAYQNRSLGRGLKAAMLARIRQERPDVQFIRTGNATSNAPMGKINAELGFRPYLTSSTWQVSTDQVLRYLQRAPSPPGQ
jgi:GNAT superfamily N-acetyltransferase